MRHYAPTLSAEESILVQPGGGNGIKLRGHQHARQFCHRCDLRSKQFAVPSINVGINGPVVTRKSIEAIAGDIKTVPDLTAL